MVLWISNIIYTSGIIENIFMIDNNINNNNNNNDDINISNNINNIDNNNNSNNSSNEQTEAINNYDSMVRNLSNIMMDYAKNVQWSSKNAEHNMTDKIQKLKHPHYDMSNKLSSFHWASILKQYNITMSGHYVVILPAIKISHVQPAEVTLKVRNPNEIMPSSSKWNALTSALDPLELNDADTEEDFMLDLDNVERPLYPKTPMEIALTIILCAVSIFVISYTIIVMYRCICSRNYAEWRSSRWDDSEIIETKSEQVLEGFPIRVKGHKHNIECIVSDGNLMASSCLQNTIKIWSMSNGELVAEINRSQYFENFPNLSDESVMQKSPARKIAHEPNTPAASNQLRLRNLNFDFHSSRVRTNGGISSDSMKNEFQKSYEKYFEIIPTRTKSFEQQSDSHPSSPNCSTKRNSSNSSSSNNNNNNIINLIKNDLSRMHSNSKNSSDNVNNSHQQYKSSPIWTLDFIDNLIVIGCADGRLEFWEGTTGNLRTIYETEVTHGDGVTHVKLASDKVVAARISGRIDFYRLETYTQGRQIDWNFTSAYRRTHIRTGSAGSLSNFNQQQNQRYVNQRNSFNSPSSPTQQYQHHQQQQQQQNHPNVSHSPTQEELRCILVLQHAGHTQPVTSLDVLGNILFTGSQDHTLKVYHTDTNTLHYTLHGHCSPITTLLIDHFQPGTGCSGSQNGLLCLWDVVTGNFAHFLKL
jgi:WD domain, G-beta repeat